jgi:hypothetical protein
MKKAILIVLALVLSGSVALGSRGRYDGVTVDSNANVVTLSNNLQNEYDWLKSASNDGPMGTLSATNRRSLLLSPGTYTMSETVLLDTDYVDVLELVEGTVTLAKSGNGMGFAVLPDIDAILITSDDRVFTGNYSRNSIASTEQTSLEINEIKDKQMPVAGMISSMDESNIAFIGNLPMNTAYTVTGLAAERTFAGRNGSNRIGSSLDNSLPYAQHGQATDLTTIAYLFKADNFGNCIASDGSTNPAKVVYGTWTEGTTSMAFAKSQLGGGDFALTSGTRTAAWSHLLTAAGTNLISEYLTNGRYIYRSTDKGATFTEVLDPGAGVITHWHGMGQNLATGRIVACAGDNAKSNVYYSDDDGITWAALLTAGEGVLQPIALLDIGHPTKLLCGSDKLEGLFLLDVISGEVTSIFKDQDRTGLRGYFFTLTQVDGIIYAGTYDLTASAAGSTVAIYATSDLVNWTAIYRVQADASIGPQTLVPFDGKILASVLTADADSANRVWHTTITPPSGISAKKRGITCEQAIANQITTAAKSSFEDASFATYALSDGTVAQVTADTAGVPSIPNGTYAVRITKAGNSVSNVTSPDGVAYGIAAAENEIISGSVMVGLPTTAKATTISARFNKDDGAASTNATTANGTITNATLRPGEWKTLYIKPMTIAAVGSDGDIVGIRVGAGVDVGTNTDILIDNVQISVDGEQSTSWQVGGTARAAAKYDVNWQTPEKATHIFSFTPFAQSSWYDANPGNYYIRSWRVSATAYAELYYTSSATAADRAFSLNVVDAGTNEVLTTATLLTLTVPIMTTAPAVGDVLTQAVSNATLTVTATTPTTITGTITGTWDTTNAFTSDDAGATMDPASITPSEVNGVWFKKGQALIFAIQLGIAGADTLKMSIGNGRTIRTVASANADHVGFGLADIKVRWGDKDAANGLNGTIYDLDMTGVMTASDITAYIDTLIGN